MILALLLSIATQGRLVVLVVFDPKVVPYERLLARFWEEHDPTQGMRQGNDVGTQYRSAIYATTDEQLRAAEPLSCVPAVGVEVEGTTLKLVSTAAATVTDELEALVDVHELHCAVTV